MPQSDPSAIGTPTSMAILNASQVVNGHLLGALDRHGSAKRSVT